MLARPLILIVLIRRAIIGRCGQIVENLCPISSFLACYGSALGKTVRLHTDADAPCQSRILRIYMNIKALIDIQPSPWTKRCASGIRLSIFWTCFSVGYVQTRAE